jgi:hypothetical protein
VGGSHCEGAAAFWVREREACAAGPRRSNQWPWPLEKLSKSSQGCQQANQKQGSWPGEDVAHLRRGALPARRTRPGTLHTRCLLPAAPPSQSEPAWNENGMIGCCFPVRSSSRTHAASLQVVSGWPSSTRLAPHPPG